MQHYDSLGEVIDVTSGEWTKLKDLARLVGQVVSTLSMFVIKLVCVSVCVCDAPR